MYKKITLVFILALACCNTLAEPYSIAKVVDGDTVDIVNDAQEVIRIRLSQVDAPELKQPYGDASKRALLSVCPANANVRYDLITIDRYGRVIADVYCDTIYVNAWMVESGYAWVYDRYVTDKKLYRLQDSAKEKRLGLWQDKQPIAPWEYRYNAKRK